MPLLKQWNISPHAVAAIWKVEEPEEFFKEQTGLDPAIKNEKRRIERLAGRFLLKFLEPAFPIHHIDKDDHDKPRTPNNEYYFSISHSWPYVAAVIDTQNEAGIDIQTWHSGIDRIQHKFLSTEEQALFQNDHKLLALAWSAKEAAYKWNGKRGVDFIEHLPISFFELFGENSKIKINFNINEIDHNIFIDSIITTDFTCSYVILIEKSENK